MRHGLYRNPVSYLGIMVAGAGLLLVAMTLAMEIALPNPSPYLGIFSFMVFPAVSTGGAVIFLYGMRRESLRRRRCGDENAPPYPRLDLNDPLQRRRFAWMAPASLFVLIVLAFVAYNAFHFTESVPFCGKVCHTVMEPEYTAYLNSPHARVACVECHVGSGASWYVKSKLSGLRQVVKVLTDTYEAPIEVPIANLRPARETCEECHWPAKFFGAQLIQNPHFRYDEANTAEQMSLLVKTGGRVRGAAGGAGIHWSMVLGNRITFVATDRQVQDIPWTKVVRPDGSSSVYWSLDQAIEPGQVATLPEREISCIDCHNRPSHQYPPPDLTADRSLASGELPAKLPWIKKVAVDALRNDYGSRDEGHKAIDRAIRGFYSRSSPAPDTGKLIDEAVAGTTAIYDRTVFPEMKVDWTTYASNIGHRNWKGCFRCHDGRHVRKEDGKVLTRDCTVCHTMPVRAPLAGLGESLGGSDVNWHLWELKGRHEELQCVACHQAGRRPPPTCAECHKLDVKAPMMGSCDDCHTTPQRLKPIADCKDCHDDVGGLHTEGEHPEAACTTCHKPHGWAVPQARETCTSCHKDRNSHHPGEPCQKCHGFRKT
jgi:hypothetical protein